MAMTLPFPRVQRFISKFNPYFVCVGHHLGRDVEIMPETWKALSVNTWLVVLQNNIQHMTWGFDR